MIYYVYMVLCADSTIYTGITNDLVRRISEHNGTKKGARYTASRKPVILVFFEKCPSKGTALKREYEIKSLTKKEKIKIYSAFLSSSKNRQSLNTLFLT